MVLSNDSKMGMKEMKKISLGFLTALVLTFMLGAQAFAAYGEVQFSDPEAKTGEEVEITAKMTCGGALIGDGELTLKYDPEYLEFVSGTGQKNEGEGTVTIFNAGTGTETELSYSIKFNALKEGETVVEVTGSTAYLWSNETLNLTLGNSTVKIGKGTGGSKKKKIKGDGPEVSIDGKKYNIVNDIPPAVIPKGFSEVKTSFSGEDCKAIQQDVSGQQAFYLSNGKKQDLFLYDGEGGTFAPFELMDISETSYLIFLQDDGTLKIPKGFMEATLTVNGKEFPVWQSSNYTDYYLIYGLNDSGEKQLYLYDNKEGTYQRFTPDLLKKKEAPKQTAKRSGVGGMLLDLIERFLKPFLIGVGALLLFMLIMLLVMSRKVHNRNVEIDDLYDELDGKKPIGKPVGADFETDDYGGTLPFSEDLFGESDFDEYDNFDSAYDFDDDDDFFEKPTSTLPVKLTDTLANHKPLEATLSGRKKAKADQAANDQKFHVDADDTFKIDFIDL